MTPVVLADALPGALFHALPEFANEVVSWSFWARRGYGLHWRWGVLLFLAAMPLVWAFQFLAPRRWWLVFLSFLSLGFIAFTLMPWPVDGALPQDVDLPGVPRGAPMTAAWRAVLGVLHAGLVVLLMVGVFRLARAAEKQAAVALHPRRPLLISVVLLVAGYFALYALRHVWCDVDNGAQALTAYMILPRFHEAGLAYLFVRAVHYVWDSSRGLIQNRGWWRFFCWITFFPSFRVGPIERFHDFHTQVLRCHRRWRATDLLYGAGRIGEGCLKGLVAIYLIEHGVPDLAKYFRELGSLDAVPYWELWGAGWVLLLMGYAFLAGYTDVAVGLARLMGYRMVENFRWLILSENLGDLWHRVHISMSRCLRDYCYYPLVRRGPFRRPRLPAGGGPLTRRQELRRILLPSVNYFITFVLCGLWHQPRINCVVWGLCVGCGMVVYELWAWFWQRRARAEGTEYRLLRRLGIAGGGPIGRVLGIIVTLNFFSITFYAMLSPGMLLGVGWELVSRPMEWLLAVFGLQG